MGFPTVRLLDVDALVSDGAIKSFINDFTKKIEFYLWVRWGPDQPSRFRFCTFSTHREWR